MEIKTTRNIPRNIKEEAETAQALEGLVSKDTQLGVLSIVSNVSKEIEKMESESNANRTDEETVWSWWKWQWTVKNTGGNAKKII